MEHLNQDVVNYIKSRITNDETVTSGDIETIYTATFDSGMTIQGKSVRPINGFEQDEARNAAYENAIDKIYHGVAFALNK